MQKIIFYCWKNSKNTESAQLWSQANKRENALAYSRYSREWKTKNRENIIKSDSKSFVRQMVAGRVVRPVPHLQPPRLCARHRHGQVQQKVRLSLSLDLSLSVSLSLSTLSHAPRFHASFNFKAKKLNFNSCQVMNIAIIVTAGEFCLF